jgi:hypothetical protein
MATRLRVFISSPGDVRAAREVAARTVEKIARDYLRFFEIEPYMWETEALVASGHFQDAIEPPSRFDIVALILWSRLGTLLPEKTAVRSYAGIDGRAPVTGTEWEYEDALRAARERGVPDLLVYRSRKPAHVDSWDAERRQQELEQLAALDRFWSRHFADRGTFIGAYHEFVDDEELAAAFEAHLRQLVDHRIAALTPAAAGEGARTRIWPRSPFRGLETFEYEHAPIFFGREEAVGKALGQLIDNAEAGAAFLLVLGASGSGKSSLVRAGVAPRLALPRRVVGRSFTRRVLFRPSERRNGEDLFDALARALATKTAEGVGLPEVGNVQPLAGVLRGAPEHAHALIAHALDGVTNEARTHGKMLRHEEAALLLVVDQLEELFTDHNITASERQRFIVLIRALAHCGRVWIVATMRADLWHRASETPELVVLASGLGRFDLLPPGPAELSQMIRMPSQAAGLTFEKNPVDGMPLNDRIAEEAAGASGVLPLLSYLLEQLYHADAVEAGGAVLTFASYWKLGRLKGSIAARAESILAGQTEEVRAALRSVLFALVQVNTDPGGATTVTARRAPLNIFPENGPARRLIDAFLAPTARLLVADQDGDGPPTVRVAHEALLSEWSRAREYMADDASLLAIRRRTEERYLRWQEIGPGRKQRWWAVLDPEQGVLTGIDLGDARRLSEEYGGELPVGLIEYVERSTRQDRRRRHSIVFGVSAIALSLAALAAVDGVMAYLAQSNATQAMVQLRRSELLDAQTAADDDRLVKKDFTSAIAGYGQVVALAEQLIRIEPTEPLWWLDMAAAHQWRGYSFHLRGASNDQAQMKSEYELALAAAQRCAALNSGSPQVLQDCKTLGDYVQSRLAH